MAKNDSVTGSMLVLATVVGGMFGAVAGLLLAPQSGKKTQEKLLETYGKAEENVNSLVKKADEKFSGIMSKVTAEVKDLPEQVKSEVGKLSKEAGETFQKTVEKGATYLDDIKGTVSTTVQEGKKLFNEKKDQLTAGK